MVAAGGTQRPTTTAVTVRPSVIVFLVNPVSAWPCVRPALTGIKMDLICIQMRNVIICSSPNFIRQLKFVGNFSRLRTNIWKTEDGETLGSPSIIKEKRRRRRARRWSNKPVCRRSPPQSRPRPPAMSACHRAARQRAGAELASARRGASFVLARPSALLHDSTAVPTSPVAPSDGGEVEDKEL